MIGRNEQLDNLNSYYSSDSNNLTIIYGRYRIGKTTLVKEFLKDKTGIYYHAIPGVVSEQIENLNRSMETQLVGFVPGTSYESVFTEIVANSIGVKTIVIEEFQNIVKADSEFMDCISRLIKGELTDRKIMVILTCSSISWIENSMVKAIGSAAFSINAFMKLKELNYADTVGMFHESDPNSLLCIYAVTGGIPGYMRHWNPNESVRKNICNLFIEREGIFSNEAQLFVKDEFREIGVYNTILGCLAGGMNKLNEIHNYTGFGRDKISVYLKNLIEREIVEKVFSYDNGSNEYTRKGLYQIKDDYIHFWYKFIYPHYSMLELISSEEFYTRYVEPGFEEFLKESYIKIAGEFLDIMNDMNRLPFEAEKKGSWHGKTGDIHIIYENNIDHRGITGQVFTQKSLIGMEQLEQLKSNSDLAGIDVKNFYLFTLGDFSMELKQYSESSNEVTLIRIDDL